MQLPLVLFGDAGHVHHAPDLALSLVIADEHVQKFAGIDRITLGLLGAAVDLDGRGVDDEVEDALVAQAAVEPEAIAPRLVARGDGGVLGQAEALLGLGDLLTPQSAALLSDRNPSRRVLGAFSSLTGRRYVLDDRHKLRGSAFCSG